MILIEKTQIVGFEPAIRGMRNPLNSWEKSDSGICKGGDDGIGCPNCANYRCDHDYDGSYQIGRADFELMSKLAKAGSVHAKYRRMMVVYVDVTAPLYWWKEFDTYKVATVANSCSTMHKIAAKEFTLDDFSCEHLMTDNTFRMKNDKLEDVNLLVTSKSCLMFTCNMLNNFRKMYNAAYDPVVKKQWWWQMIQLLPSSYNQKRTIELNYEVLVGIYRERKDHKLDEWHNFCDWIKGLPYSQLITLEM